MTKRIACFALLAVVVCNWCTASDDNKELSKDKKTVKLTIVLRGADTDADIETLKKKLRSADGVRILTDDVAPGFRKFKNRFTTPIVVQLPTVPGDNDVNVGSVATTVSEATTKNASKFAPGVNLILFTDDTLTEESISALRSSLSSVNGTEVSKPGGLGANISEGWCWIRLEDAGGAMLNDIEEKARRSGIKFRRLREADSE